MFYIGCHLSASDGFLAMGKTALSIGANTFQFFTRNPRGSKAKAIDPADVAAFLALAAENGFGTLVAHAPYTINPCSKDERTREFARMTLADDPDGVLTEFDRVIGLDRLRAVHVNDSLNPVGSHKDRHARIGEGCLGAEALGRVVRHPALQGLPFVLETPNELPGYAREIALLKELHGL